MKIYGLFLHTPVAEFNLIKGSTENNATKAKQLAFLFVWVEYTAKHFAVYDIQYFDITMNALRLLILTAQLFLYIFLIRFTILKCVLIYNFELTH